jgi:uncharacterized protein YwbE
MDRSPQTISGESDDPVLASYQSVKTSRLRVGSVLRFPINDEHNVLLLADGQTITSNFLAKLRQRGVLSIKVHEDEVPRICAGEPQGTATTIRPHHDAPVCELRNDWTEMLDEEIGKGLTGIPPQGEAFEQGVAQLGDADYNETLRDEMAGRRCVDVIQIHDVFESLAVGQGLNIDVLSEVTDSALADMQQDSDLFACIGGNPFSEGYPARHSLHVCMVAIVVGTRLQLDRTTLKELAIGCLIHDSGMLKINQAVYKSRKLLSPVEFLEVTKHPVIVFDMMKEMRSVNNRSAFIAYQMHERNNGTGYPRRLPGHRIHFLSKLAAVADTYVGLVSPRAYRPALLPYYAMEMMLKGVKAGMYDASAVRALLDALSLFPPGSYVQLSDGRLGRVLRSRRDAYTQPIVEAWDAENLDSRPEIVNLADLNLRVVKPLRDLHADHGG